MIILEINIKTDLNCLSSYYQWFLILQGSILLIIFFCGLFVYFAVGAGIQYKRGEHGARILIIHKFVVLIFEELVPNYTFWVSLPGLIKDGFMFTLRKLKISKQGSSYESVK
jgi:hypothetical protein